MLGIAVVDDEQVHRNLLTNYIEEWKADRKAEAAVTSFASCEAFLFEWSENECFDVLFLDIMMNGITGMSLARKLREDSGRRGMESNITIIFTTGISDYLQEGYEVEALRYLLKPLEKEKVWQCLDKCAGECKKKERLLALPTQEGVVKLSPGVILYGEAVGHYTRLVYEGGEVQLKMGIHELDRELSAVPGAEFVFSHRSYLVNVRKISRILKADVLMDGGESVPLSRRNYNQVYDRFMGIFRPVRE